MPLIQTRPLFFSPMTISPTTSTSHLTAGMVIDSGLASSALTGATTFRQLPLYQSITLPYSFLGRIEYINHIFLLLYTEAVLKIMGLFDIVPNLLS